MLRPHSDIGNAKYLYNISFVIFKLSQYLSTFFPDNFLHKCCWLPCVCLRLRAKLLSALGELSDKNIVWDLRVSFASVLKWLSPVS